MKAKYIFFKILIIGCIAIQTFAQKAGTIDNSFFGNFLTRPEAVVDSDGRIFATNGVAIFRHLQNGGVDYSFNGGIGFSNSGINILQMKITPDNKLVVLGTSGSFYVVKRYNIDGTADNTFVGGGSVFIYSSSTYTNGYALCIQDDGKILVGVTINSNGKVIRLNSNGSYDLSFATDGVYTISNPGYIDGIAIENDGKILIVFNFQNSYSTYIYRLSSSGSFEQISSTLYLTVSRGIGVQSDNKIIVAGLYPDNGYKLGVQRLNPNLTIDTSFGTNGVAVYYDARYRPLICLQPDQKIIVTGQSSILRYDSSGNLDPSFGTNGVYPDVASFLTLQRDGKILYGSGMMKRLHGVSNFNSNKGKMITQLGYQDDVAKSFAQRSGGKWIVAGHSQNAVSANSLTDFGLIGYNADGSLDYNFGSNGIVATDFSGGTDYAYTTVVQPDGKILVGGYSNSGATYFALARYLPNGLLDNTFGTGGKQINYINNQNGGIFKITLQTDGKIIAVGWNSSYDFRIVRYNTNGSLDNTFGTNGVVSIDMLSGSYDTAIDVFIRPDGKILVSGTVESGSDSFFGICRILSNGNLDASFDGDGKFITQVGGVYDYCSSMSVQNDGKIILIGTASNGSNNTCGIIRILENGGLDTSFDSDGKRTFSIGGANYDDYPNSVAVRTDGKIIIGGNTISTANSTSTIFTTRLNSNGSFDTDYDSDGIYFTKIGYGQEELNAIKLLSDSNIFGVGAYSNGSNKDFAFISIPGCLVSNEIVTTPITSGTTLIQGKSILATNPIISPANANYKAISSVSLNAGFQVGAGSVFKAEIMPTCQF